MKKSLTSKRRPVASKGAGARPAKAARGRQKHGAPILAERVSEATEPAEIRAAGTDIVFSTPEPGFAGRALAPEPERPLPVGRRAIFFDVENTSRPEHISRVLDHLAVDWKDWRTELIAVGNWKVIGRDTARLLARHGAQLVHSAPSVGVSDWSDLRIGVAAGVWLARARPGDIVEIVTNDRAFDAVGDVAASLGIGFRRISDHGLVTAAAGTPSPEPSAGPSEQRPRRHGRGRRHRGWRDIAPSHPAGHAISQPPAGVPAGTPEAAHALAGPHTAPHDEIIAVVHELMERSPTRSVTLDTLANALKTRGFSRPPGSPRLITRLRRIKEISVSRSGVITLQGEEAATPSREPVAAELAPAVAPEVQTFVPPDMQSSGGEAPPEQPPRRRRSRRGRRRRRPQPEGAPAV